MSFASSSMCRRSAVANLVAPHRGTALLLVPWTQTRHSSLYETPGKRDEEAFLYQYDPLDVLGLPASTNKKKEVEAAMEMARSLYGPKGSKPNKSKMDRCQAAYDILMDAHSVYYTKANVEQTTRKQLMVDVMPAREAYVVQVRAYIMMMIIIFGVATFIHSMLYPTIKMARAAARGMK